MPLQTRRDPKLCPACGRSFGWRAKWAADWDAVTYCSRACRRRGTPDSDRQLERALLDALRIEGRRARLDPERWADPDIDREVLRSAVRRLAHQGRVQIWASGKRVGPDDWRGAGEVSLRD